VSIGPVRISGADVIRSARAACPPNRKKLVAANETRKARVVSWLALLVSDGDLVQRFAEARARK
jgi:hypothetical protein